MTSESASKSFPRVSTPSKPHGSFTQRFIASAKDSVQLCYSKLGRHAEALELAEDVHALHMRRRGPNHQRTLHAANNLAVCLANCGFDARRRAVLRDAYDRATNVLGVEDHTTYLLRTGLASSLYRVGEAPREDMVEAAALLEISVRVAPETYGAAHENTAFVLRFHRRVSNSIDAFDSGSTSQRPTKRRRLRLRDVDRRAEVASAEPKIPNEARVSRAGMRDSHAWAHFYGKGLTTLSQWGEQDDEEEDDDDDGEDDEESSSSLPSPPPPQDEPRSRCVVS